MKSKLGKRIFAAILTLVVAISGFSYVSDEKVQAADNVNAAVRFQDVEYSVFAANLGKTAPECTLEDADGNSCYLFAGWYQADETTPITKVTDVEENTSVKAKFVSAYLTGVACQLKADYVSTADTTNLRMVSAIDSTNYKAVGFNVYGRQNDGSEWTMYAYDETGVEKIEATTVYSNLQEYVLQGTEYVPSGDSKTPDQVFGSLAAGFKFTTATVKNIPNAYFQTIFAIKPYWITLDGTVVESTGEFNRVSDLDAGVVNVSVNIRDAKTIAAGMMNITFSDQLTFVGADCGRVFDEMKYAQSGNTIKCIGNVSAISNNATEGNDVYINLRFTKNTGYSFATGEAEFSVSVPTNGFCDKLEAVQEVKVWNVKY